LVDSPSIASMDVHVGSLMPWIDDVVVQSSIVSIEPADPTTMNISGSGAENPMGVAGVEIPMGVTLSLCDPGPSTLVPA
jgi:hypothetical protein